MSQSAGARFFDNVSSLWAGLGRFVHEIAVGLDALHRVQFDEPWKQPRRPMHGEW